MKTSYSRLNYYRKCPRLYYWRFIQNLMPAKDPVPLIVGKATHQGLAAHYSDEPSQRYIDDYFQEVLQSAAWLEEERKHLEDQRDYVHYIMTSYKEAYPREDWTVLAPEVEGSIKLGNHTFFFRTDAIVSWQTHPWLLEHKTTGQMGPIFFKKFRMDGQITTYCYCVWKVMNVRPVGAIINGIRKAKKLDKVEFARDVVTRSEDHLNEFMLQVETGLDALSVLQKAHPNSKEAWAMHTDQCVSFNRTCDYMELCHHETPGLRELFVPRVPDYVDLGKEL